MFAKLVEASIDADRVDDAGRAVIEELAPAFVAHPGALQGYWMADRDSGHVLVMTGWADACALRDEGATDGMERTRAAERVGLRIHAVQAMEVVAAHEVGGVASTPTRWVRATSVEAVPPDRVDELAGLHAETVSDLTLSAGFCASYWLADVTTGDGIALSMWSSASYLFEGEPDSRRRRRRVQHELGCRITRVSTYEAIGVVNDAASGRHAVTR